MKLLTLKKLRTDFPIIELDEEFLKKIMRSTSKEQAFYNLLFAVRHYINTHRGPLTSDLVEQVERIVERWRSKKEEIEKLYEELFTVAQKIQQRTKEREELGLTELEYALVIVLKKHVKANTRQLISDVKELLNETESLRFPRWKEKADVVSELSRKVMLFIVRKYNGRYDDLFKTRDEILEVLKR